MAYSFMSLQFELNVKNTIFTQRCLTIYSHIACQLHNILTYTFIPSPIPFIYIYMSSVCHNHNLLLSSIMTYHRVCNDSNTSDAICGGGRENPSEVPELSPSFSLVRVARSLLILLWLKVSIYHFCIFKVFLSLYTRLLVYMFRHIPSLYTTSHCKLLTIFTYSFLVYHYQFQDVHFQHEYL